MCTLRYLPVPYGHNLDSVVEESGSISIRSSALSLGALCSDKYLVPECHQEQNKHGALNKDIKHRFLFVVDQNLTKLALMEKQDFLAEKFESSSNKMRCALKKACKP